MIIKREEVLKRLAERFSTFANFVTIQNKAGFNDINKSAERLFIDVLNIVYGFELKDMNAIQDNYPAIDLGDCASRVCVQVTSESTNKKFKRTVEIFKEKKLDLKFDELIFLIISNKDLCELTDKYIKTRVINLNGLYKVIANLDENDVLRIDSYLEQNLVSRIEQSDSILPSVLMETYSMPRLNAFISFLGFEGCQECTEYLLSDLKSLEKKLSSLTKNQRECLYYIVGYGSFPKSIYGYVDEKKIVMPVDEVIQRFGDYGVRISNVLVSKCLLFVNGNFEPNFDGRYILVLMPYFFGKLDDTNLFCELKRFCDSDLDRLKRIIVGCDFSHLQ